MITKIMITLTVESETQALAWLLGSHLALAWLLLGSCLALGSIRRYLDKKAFMLFDQSERHGIGIVILGLQLFLRTL